MALVFFGDQVDQQIPALRHVPPFVQVTEAALPAACTDGNIVIVSPPSPPVVTAVAVIMPVVALIDMLATLPAKVVGIAGMPFEPGAMQLVNDWFCSCTQSSTASLNGATACTTSVNFAFLV